MKPRKKPTSRTPQKKVTRKAVAGAARQTTTAEFERFLKKAGSDQRYVLRLYIAGTTERSIQAIANLRTMCAEYLAGRYDLEVIDIYQQPEATAEGQIIAAPTLIKELPLPPKRLVGDLSNRERVLVGLNLAARNGAKPLETKWLKL